MNIVLIGYRGSGKTTVGMALADHLGLTFVDTDRQIEKQAGISIRDIFDREGEPGFRRREHDAIAACAKESGCVLSVGGGAVETPEITDRLHRWGMVIWLTADPDVLWQRMQQDPTNDRTRPDLAGGGIEEVRDTLTRRTPLYRRCAHHMITTDGLTVDQIIDEIITLLDETGTGKASNDV